MMLNSLLPLITLSSPGQIAFFMGEWPVRWYGIFIATGFLLVYVLCENTVKQNKLDLNHYNDLVFYVLIFSVVFARLWFVFLSFDYFKYHVDEVPKIWMGGQSIHGAIFGSILTAYIYSRFKKISFYKYMDILACFVPLGQAIGRWGNFFNNEAFGKPFYNGFIRLFIPEDSRPSAFVNEKYFHPTFLYESFLDFIIFVFLMKSYQNWKEKEGKCFWAYLFGYSLIRFFLEFFRTDSLCLFTVMPAAQVVSLTIFIVSCFMLWKIK